MLVTAAILVLGALISSLASSLAVLLAGRILVGAAIGVASFVAPLYIAEISSPEMRGALVSLNQLAITCGILVSYLVGYGLSHDGLWRWMLALGALPGLVLGGAMLMLPETPRWLAGRGHAGEAREVLQRMLGDVGEVERVVAELRRDLLREGHDLGWRGLVEPSARKVCDRNCGVVLA